MIDRKDMLDKLKYVSDTNITDYLYAYYPVGYRGLTHDYCSLVRVYFDHDYAVYDRNEFQKLSDENNADSVPIYVLSEEPVSLDVLSHFYNQGLI